MNNASKVMLNTAKTTFTSWMTSLGSYSVAGQQARTILSKTVQLANQLMIDDQNDQVSDFRRNCFLALISVSVRTWWGVSNGRNKWRNTLHWTLDKPIRRFEEKNVGNIRRYVFYEVTVLKYGIIILQYQLECISYVLV